MRSSRIALGLPVFFFVLFSLYATGHTAETWNGSQPPSISNYHAADIDWSSIPSSTDGGVKEIIPAKYTNRYLAWKKDFLSTPTGREQWEFYENNPQFTLTITVLSENAEGATTGKYRWNQAGKLIAATIVLGSRLDDGYPSPIYFPVMNSLMGTEATLPLNGTTLASTKIAHEFGHVIRTAQVDPHLYQLQMQLIPQYNKIFLNNGRDANDPRLLELAQQMGGTPVAIWEDREYWGETNAMVYLRDRITEDNVRCFLFNRIRHSIDMYAKQYEQRFFQIAQANPSKKLCGWQ